MKVMCDEEALELASIAAIASPEETEAANESPAATEPPPDEA
ncbi:hypothetical protein [Methylocystis sp. WRRC1]|nr:hypothetical protein [Methylocystis sp. WRRC1]